MAQKKTNTRPEQEHELLPGEIRIGEFISSFSGIYFRERCICSTWFKIICKYKDITTNRVVYSIAYSRMLPSETTADGRSIMSNNISGQLNVPASTLANKSKLIDLAEYEIDINSNNASSMTEYFRQYVNNIAIPEIYTSTRLGWHKLNDAYTFIPYAENVEFDALTTGTDDIKLSLTSKGTFDEWREYVTPLARTNFYTRLLIATSLASPLLYIFKVNPFIVHFWGASGLGKTLGMMLALSVWGEPSPDGGLFQSLRNTVNSTETLLNIFNHMIYCADEMQTIKDSYGTYDKFVMAVTERKQRTRVSTNGSLVKDSRGKWQNVILTNGNEPLIKDKSIDGAINRVIQVETTHALIDGRGYDIADFLTKHFGTCGKVYIQRLSKCFNNAEALNTLKALFDKCMSLFDNVSTDAKQKTAFACLMVADTLANKSIYTEPLKALTVDDFEPYIVTNDQISMPERAKEYIINFISQNDNKFRSEFGADIYGKYDDENVKQHVYINKNVLVDALQKNEFDFNAVKRVWANNGFLVKPDGRKSFDHLLRLYGSTTHVIKLKLY